MPPIAAVPIAIAGAGASASGGKKAANAASQASAGQLALQQQQLGLEQQLISTGQQYLKPAADYWTALLKGGPQAMQAVGPSAQNIMSAYGASRNTIAQNLPMGGERNLALAQNQTGQARDIAGLYAGVQPAAAQGLLNTVQPLFGVGSSIAPQAASGAALNALVSQQALAQQGTQGFGNLLYNAFQKAKG